MACSADPFDPEADPVSRRVVTGLARLGRVLRHESWQRAGRRGLTPTQGQILAVVAARGPAMRLSSLAAELGATLATASDSVRALEEKGLLTRGREPGDRRALAIRLTAAGRAEAQRASAWTDVLLSAVDALSEEERGVFLQGLTKMIRNLQDAGRIPVAHMCVGCRYFRPFAHADPIRPHHCAFVDAPFGNGSFRLDCPDWEGAPASEAYRAWQMVFHR